MGSKESRAADQARRTMTKNRMKRRRRELLYQGIAVYWVAGTVFAIWVGALGIVNGWWCEWASWGTE